MLGHLYVFQLTYISADFSRFVNVYIGGQVMLTF